MLKSGFLAEDGRSRVAGRRGEMFQKQPGADVPERLFDSFPRESLLDGLLPSALFVLEQSRQHFIPANKGLLLEICVSMIILFNTKIANSAVQMARGKF
jgi:hypothetical protein